MEIWTGHDIDGDGSPDVYIGHKLPNDPTGFGGVFLVIFMGLFVVSFFLFAAFDDKEGSNLMGIGIFSILGSATVAGLIAWKACLKATYGPLVPLGAFVGFFVLGFAFVGLLAAGRSSAEAAKQRVDAADSARSNAIGSKLDRMRERGKGVVEQAKDRLSRRGWKIKDSWASTPMPKNGGRWYDASEVPEREMVLYISAEPPFPKDVTIEIRYHQDERKSMIQAYGRDETDAITSSSSNVEAKHEPDEHISGIVLKGHRWHSLKMTDMRELKQGTLRQLCGEMEGSITTGVAQNDAADQQEAERKAQAEASKPKSETGSRFGWIAVVLLAAILVGGAGALLIWKSRRSGNVSEAPQKAEPANGQTFRFVCSGCRARYKFGHAMLGKSFRCKKCQAMCVIPMDTEQLAVE